jgi:hypothetical protein
MRDQMERDGIREKSEMGRIDWERRLLYAQK